MTQKSNYKVANFTLIDKGLILEKFEIIKDQKILLTAEPFGFVTLVAQINHEKNLIVFESSSDEGLNQKFLKSGGCTLVGRVEGVFAVFLIKHVFEEYISGKKFYAAHIPTSLFWHQRREFYRVPIDLDKAFLCCLPLISGEVVDFPVLDITLSGLAIYDQNRLFDYEYKRGHIFDPCSFRLEGLEKESFGLELRNKPRKELGDGRRIGLSFLGFNPVLASHLDDIITKFGAQELSSVKG